MAKTNDVKIRLRSTGSQKVKKDLKGITTQTANMIKGVVGVTAAYQGMKKVLEFTEQAGKLKALETAHKNLSKAQSLNAKVMIDEMQKATKGTVLEMDLLQQANNALLLGLPVTERDMGLLASAGRRLGKAMGVDAKMGLESLVVGIGRQSKLWLDNLGIIVDTNKAYKDYAISLGKTSGELTDAEKKLAFYGATMDSIHVKLGQLGEDHEDVADDIQRARVAWENFTLSLGTVLSSPVASFFSDMAEKIDIIAIKLGLGAEGLEGTLEKAELHLKGLRTEQEALLYAQAEQEAGIIRIDQWVGNLFGGEEKRLGQIDKANQAIIDQLALIEALNVKIKERNKLDSAGGKPPPIDTSALEKVVRLEDEIAGFTGWTNKHTLRILETRKKYIPIAFQTQKAAEKTAIAVGLASLQTGEMVSKQIGAVELQRQQAEQAERTAGAIMTVSNTLTTIINKSKSGGLKFSDLLGLAGGIASVVPGGQLWGAGLAGGGRVLGALGAQHGADFHTDKPTLIMAGEGNKREHVKITPAPINNNDNSKSMSINFYGDVYDIDQAAEKIAERSGLGFNRIAINA